MEGMLLVVVMLLIHFVRGHLRYVALSYIDPDESRDSIPVGAEFDRLAQPYELTCDAKEKIVEHEEEGEAESPHEPSREGGINTPNTPPSRAERGVEERRERQAN